MIPAVAVAVVSWNTAELLAACLRSLGTEVAANRAQVWVVDNGSSDGSPEMVEREFPAVRLLRPGTNLGFGPAVNLVAERTESPWIAAANADVEVHEGALTTLLGVGEADPRCAVVAPRLITRDGGTQHSVHSFPTATLSAVAYSGLARIVPRLGEGLCLEGHWKPDRPRYVDWAHGAFVLVRRVAFDRIGGFDPDQWMYAEDLDLAWRLRRCGWRVRYEPRARVRHAVSAATEQAFGEGRRRLYMRATFAWMVRRRGLVATWWYAAVNVAGSALRWLLSLPGSLLGRGSTPRRTYRAYIGLHRQGLRRRSRLLEIGHPAGRR